MYTHLTREPFRGSEAVAAGSRRRGSSAVPSSRRSSAAPTSARRSRSRRVAVTSPARTAFDLARRDAPPADRVAAVDALAHAHGFGRPALQEVLDEHPGVRGSVGVREVLALMDPLSESLMETRTRLVVHLAGLPAPVLQHRVDLPTGGHARLDLAWPEHKVALEYDGEEHRTPQQHAHDLERDAALAELGWRVLRVTARRVYRAPDTLVRRLARMLDNAA